MGLVVCIMGQNCEKFIGMALESVKDADALVYCDGGSTDKTGDIIADFIKNNKWVHFIQNRYDQEDIGMNGKQRNFYLNYLKENYPDDWALCLDADEVLDDEGIQALKKFISTAHPTVYNVHMRHFIGDLGHEDSTTDKHWVPRRLFKISEVESYPEVEHPVLVPKKMTSLPSQRPHTIPFKDDKEELYWLEGYCDVTTIYHLAYIPNIWEIKKRYDNHMKKSNMHTPQYLKQWYTQHLFGTYPREPLDISEIPSTILKTFNIEKDELYFRNRTLELKHFLDAIYWRDHFKCKTALELGCGLGPRVWALNEVGVETYGIELSQWATDHAYIKDKVIQGDITQELRLNTYDLVICYDVLEHIEEIHLNKVINNISKLTKRYVLVSVPVLGDPNLERDKTHRIKQSRNWWVEQFTQRGFKELEVPAHFLYRNQLMIFEHGNDHHPDMH